ncbi:hypothetical protein CR513_09311, partial [Mucuna pruriens]
MSSTDPDFLCHHLSIYLGARLVSQKKRRLGEEKKRAIKAEISKLLQTRFIREVKYPSWLSNVVMVRKPSGKWRMCTDYIDLNRVYPKNPYPLPSIDALVDGASRCGLLSFMDTYLGYNQIRMHPSDVFKTAFITDGDDMVVKCKTETGHAENLATSPRDMQNRLTNQANPTKKPDLAGRMIGWAAELFEFDIAYERRGYMKAQVLANFINELTPNSHKEEVARTGLPTKVGVILEGLGGILVEQSLRFGFRASNNQAESMVGKGARAKMLTVKSDSQFLTRQVNDEYQAKDLQLTWYLGAMKAQAETLKGKLKQSEPLKRFMREHVEAILVEGP